MAVALAIFPWFGSLVERYINHKLHPKLHLFKCDSFVLNNFIALRIKNRYSLFFIYEMNHLNKPNLISICKILIKQNNDEDKKLKKFKQTNGNIKNYNRDF